MKLLSISGFSLTQELTNPFPPWRNEKNNLITYNIHNSVARACVCRRRSKLYTPAARFGLLVNATHGHELFQVCTYPNPQKISCDKWHVVNIFFHKYFLEKNITYILVSRISHDLWCIFRRQEMYCYCVPQLRRLFSEDDYNWETWLGQESEQWQKIAVL